MEIKNPEKKEGVNMIITTPDSVSDCETSKDANYGRMNTLYPPALLDKRMRSIFITIPKSYQDKSALFNALKTSSKSLKYVLVATEQHKDNTPHFHIQIEFKNSTALKSVHNKIMEIEGNIGGAINYQSVKNSEAVNNYCKKEDGNYLEFGNKKKTTGRPLSYDKEGENIAIKNVFEDGETTIEEKMEYIKEQQPLLYVDKGDKIKAKLEEQANKDRPTWDIPEYDPKDITLRPYQKQIWDLVSKPPKARQIIWVYGKPNMGKSFMYNYLEHNYKYRVYNAGQSASLDNVVYGYDEEGAIIWDIPKSYNWENEELVNTLASTIEKFSDFGTILTSKKYGGRKVAVKGHAIIFSNRRVIEQLKHRDIIEIVAGERLINKRYRIKKNDEKEHYVVNIDNYTTKYFYTKKEFEQFIEDTEDYYDD